MILENGLIPNGATLEFDPSGHVNQESVGRLNEWLDAEPGRRSFTWNSGSEKPLSWAITPDEEWTATGLCKELFNRANTEYGSFAATQAWFYEGENLAVVAQRELPESDD